MAKCDTCGNDYEESLSITYKGRAYEFDCFECAIQELAPVCAQCGVRVMGHGLQYDEQIFCCVHCASRAGVTGFTDHTRSGTVVGLM